MRINISDEGRYVPEWEGNRDLPEDEQIVITYTCIDHNARKKYQHFEKPNYSVETAGKSNEEIEAELTEQTRRVEFKAWTDDDKIAIACKPRITNLEDMDGNPIDTWEKLLKVPQTKGNQIGALISEVEKELGTLAKEDDSKNSE
jgi:hypothetical protein